MDNLREMTREQLLLLELEDAVKADGILAERVPVSGIGDELESRGLVKSIQPKFLGVGVYEVTESGREFVSKNIPPSEW